MVEKKKIELLLTSASSSTQSSRINDSSKDLGKDLSYLNVKENQVDDLRKIIISKNDEINLLREQINENDGLIVEYQNLKDKLQKELSQAHSKMDGKAYLIGTSTLYGIL